MRVDCNSRETANELVKVQPFPGKKCFVPHLAKYMVGILKDIDVTTREEEIIDMFNPVFNKVFRMTRFDKNTQECLSDRSKS